MADKDDDQNDKPGGTIGDRLSEEDARKLLNRSERREDDEDNEQDEDRPGRDSESEKDGDSGGDRKYAEIAAGRKKARERAAAAEKRAADLEAKVREYETAGQSETERLQGERESLKVRAEKAETYGSRVRIALETAPKDGLIDPGVLQKVIKRMSGEDEAGLTEDAEELWADLAKSTGRTPAASSKPRERLRGGGEPAEDRDVKSVAAQIPRSRF